MFAVLKRRLVDPVLALLRQGLSPRELALSLSFGAGVGIFPVLGVSTPLLTGIALWMRLNLPAIQLVNYLASPLQLLLIIPFVRVGEALTGAPPQPLSVSAGMDMLAGGVLQAIVVLWDGKTKLTPSTRFVVHWTWWILQSIGDSVFDPLEPNAQYEIWASVKLTGPSYAPGSKKQDAVYLDRVIFLAD